jgi:hypothetical protein
LSGWHPNNGGKYKIEGLRYRLAWAKREILSPKYPEQKGLEVWLKQNTCRASTKPRV